MNPHRQLAQVDDLRTHRLPWSLGQLLVSIVMILFLVALYAVAARADERSEARLLDHAMADAALRSMPLEVEAAYWRGVHDTLTSLDRAAAADARAAAGVR